MQTRALNTARAQESQQWHSILQTYYAIDGNFANIPAGTYCLGSGFPDGDGVPGGECRDTHYAPNAYHEIENTPLMNELRKVSPNLPSGPRNLINGTVGPYVIIWQWGYYLTNVFQGDSADDCPGGTTFAWADESHRVLCHIGFEP